MASYEAQKITEALVGTKWRHDYNNNRFFRHAVDTLVQMLPFWIDGLALKAYEDEQKVEQLRIAIESTPPRPLLIPPEHPLYGEQGET